MDSVRGRRGGETAYPFAREILWDSSRRRRCSRRYRRVALSVFVSFLSVMSAPCRRSNGIGLKRCHTESNPAPRRWKRK